MRLIGSNIENLKKLISEIRREITSNINENNHKKWKKLPLELKNEWHGFHQVLKFYKANHINYPKAIELSDDKNELLELYNNLLKFKKKT